MTLANCATGSRPAATPTELARVVDPTAGTVTYKGRTIVFDEAADPPLVTIDGKPIKVRRLINPPETRYSSSATIYVDYTSLWQLARGVIDTGVPGY